ncbi:MAG: sigma-70 family RNA polymerase sigma factor [Planctomycetes bacterium]|nr:sigma-70 family RNA polymerase sigma factor [Planctomycetota bacterium]
MTEPSAAASAVSRLAARAAAGSAEAWEALYLSHEAAVYGFLYHRVGRDRTLADDLFHDTFLKAVERIAQFDPERGEFCAWLIGIARNELRQRARRVAGRARVVALDAEVPAELAAEDPAPRDLKEAVNLAFSALSARQQQALALKYTEGASLEAIARALDSTPGAVGSLLHRARAAFRQAYDRLRSRGSA